MKNLKVVLTAVTAAVGVLSFSSVMATNLLPGARVVGLHSANASSVIFNQSTSQAITASYPQGAINNENKPFFPMALNANTQSSYAVQPVNKSGQDWTKPVFYSDKTGNGCEFQFQTNLVTGQLNVAYMTLDPTKTVYCKVNGPMLSVNVSNDS